MLRPRIAVTSGDPAGIGPEIAARALLDPRVHAVAEPILYGPPAGEVFAPGCPTAASGHAAYEAFRRAVADAQAGRVHAVATAPVSKLAFAMAGLPWKGHTDLLAHLTGAEHVAMLFWSEKLRVVLATVHVPLSEVPRLLTRDLLLKTLTLAARELPSFGVPRPRLALAGLNPHAGEAGVLGHEEERVLAPAVEEARGRGIDVSGPLPGDTVFLRALRGEFDCVIACYHDQGLIPVKLASFGRAVNVTIGAPVVRTSVDHGTAFDIAGRGVADHSSLVEAILLAARLARVSIDLE